jgi:hypothetical protein
MLISGGGSILSGSVKGIKFFEQAGCMIWLLYFDRPGVRFNWDENGFGSSAIECPSIVPRWCLCCLSTSAYLTIRYSVIDAGARLLRHPVLSYRCRRAVRSYLRYIPTYLRIVHTNVRTIVRGVVDRNARHCIHLVISQLICM